MNKNKGMRSGLTLRMEEVDVHANATSVLSVSNVVFQQHVYFTQTMKRGRKL